jgi:UTP--glucose-1-phosphate uridylyltransferase
MVIDMDRVTMGELSQFCERELLMPPFEASHFAAIFCRFRDRPNRPVEWERIRCPPAESILKLEGMPAPGAAEARSLLSRLAVCKMNGGLGTSMGCVGPKSAIEVRDKLTFLDLIVTQVEGLNAEHGARVPLILMNSFNTHKTTQSIVGKYGDRVEIISFNQSKYPRIRVSDNRPLPLFMDGLGHGAEDDEASGWYPPGHGDFFSALHHTGVLDQLLERGVDWIFLSNADNLGATVDLSLLSALEAKGCGFAMEVTTKTLADVKGGTLVTSDGGKTVSLLELAQVPAQHVDEFKSIDKFNVFNTNNLWVRLTELKRILDEAGGQALDLDIIRNPKIVGTTEVLQLETAAGSAIRFFRNASGVLVPRSRFLPVKTTDDLLLVKSDLYQRNAGILTLNPSSQPRTQQPKISLGTSFKFVHDFDAHFARGIPSIKNLKSLLVHGSVFFGSNVTLEGDVEIDAERDSTIHIPDGSILSNCKIAGSLVISRKN